MWQGGTVDNGSVWVRLKRYPCIFLFLFISTFINPRKKNRLSSDMTPGQLLILFVQLRSYSDNNNQKKMRYSNGKHRARRRKKKKKERERKKEGEEEEDYQETSLLKKPEGCLALGMSSNTAWMFFLAFELHSM